MGGDVTNPQSLNRYAYVMNNPTTFTDPTGLEPVDPLACEAGDFEACPPPPCNPFDVACNPDPCGPYGIDCGAGVGVIIHGGGSAGGGGSVGGTTASAPPAGTYTITVTGTYLGANGSSSLTHSATLTLTVQ